MMKTLILAATAAAAVSFAGAACAEDFPATPMNSGAPTMQMMPMPQPMMQPMAPEQPMMQKKMTKRQKMMMKKKMMSQEPAQ